MRFRPTPPLLMLRRLVRSVEDNGIRGAAVHSYQRLVRSLRNHGFKGTFDRAFRKAPTAPAPAETAPTHPFDLLHGTDTGGYISGAALEADSLSNLYSTAYLGTAPSALTQAIHSLPIQPRHFSFVDLGCGKGRALMVAAQFPFRNLIGVEFVPGLCDIARDNIARKAEWAARISILNQDATAVTYPETPLVLYLFDPFLAPVLRRVLTNLERQLRRSPRETWILYANKPRTIEVVERFPFLREISQTAYTLTPEDSAADQFHQTHWNITVYSSTITD
jgi:SAM-dependent methyltransferase